MSRIRSFVVSSVSIAMLGVFALPGVARAATVVVTVTDGSTVVAGAFVAVVDTSNSGSAVDAVVSGADGTASLNVGSVALANLKVIVSRQGFETATTASVSAATTVALKASTSSSLKFANVFGAQTEAIVADTTSGVFYGISSGVPSVWRTTDYAGTWTPVPTKADSATGLDQLQARKVAASGFTGEVAVTLRQGLWYSRDYGTTWSSLDTQSNFDNVWWVHSGTSSYLFALAGSTMKVAVMSAASPSLSSWTLPAGLAATDVWAFAAGIQSSNQVFAAAAPRDGATSVKVFSLAQAAASAAGVTVSATLTTSNLTFANTNTNDVLMISSLNSADIRAIAAYDKEGTGSNVGGSTGTLRLAYRPDASTAFSYSTGAGNLVGTTSYESMSPWNTYSTIGSLDASSCGENETNPVGSIAPLSPGAGVYSSFAFVGTIRQCMFAMNTTGSTAKWANQTGADVPSGKTVLLPMQGANNGTGFVFDGGFDFSTNWVAVSGDGQFGFRKSAAAFATPTFRPTFGQPGQDVADSFILNQAKPGKGTDSGGIAVNGIVAPTVQDIAMSPNSTDGSTYLVSTGESGGSRTLLTTDSGKSFSTLNTAGATQLDWWNGADGKQWILGGAPLTLDNFFKIKWFTAANGSSANQMGEELSATAAQRDSVTDSSLRFTTNSSPLKPLALTCFGLDRFINKAGTPCTGGPYDSSQGKFSMTASAGIVGTDKVLVGVSRGSIDQQGQTRYGSVALLTLTSSPSNDGASIGSALFFGANVDQDGTSTDATSQFGNSKSSTYDEMVTAIAYCPTGSAPQVADKAFVAVYGKGVYVISNVSTAPRHNGTPVTTTSFKDLKADCDTGLLVGASANGPMLSFDAQSYVKLPSGKANDIATVDVQANKTNGDVSVLTGSGANVVEIDTSFAALGTTGEKVAAGTEKTPTVPPTLSPTSVTALNDPNTGRELGQVADVEFSTETGDTVTKSSVRSAGVSAQGVSSFASADRKSQIASSSGAYSASLAQQTLSTLLPGGTPTATPTPGATTTPGTTPGTSTVGTPAQVVSKVSLVKKGKTIPLASAVKKAGGTIPVKSKVVVSQTAASKKVCKVIGVTKIQGLKTGTCAITVKITPPKSVKVKKPKTITVKVSVSVT